MKGYKYIGMEERRSDTFRTASIVIVFIHVYTVRHHGQRKLANDFFFEWRHT